MSYMYKDVERSSRDLFLMYYPRFSLEGLRKITKILNKAS